ncbi:YhbD family protein [Clostridium akagii]|uniref:YhbD family protein n=1 Tax=Clostridium akagii TaxID=91623 RepID=UPI00047DD916|nr:YhbD family protein [Clostridium akagii]
MEENLISKKELLELTKISYGQLYRWKRKKIIPEDWFIKKSSFTGQETFFPRDKILERVKRIKNMKDEASLDDLAEIFSPKSSDVMLTGSELSNRKIIIKNVIQICYPSENMDKTYSFNEVLYMDVVQRYLMDGGISIEESKIVFETIKSSYSNYLEKNCEIVFIRKMGVGISMILALPNQIYFESLAKIIMRLQINKCIEELKLKLEELF